MPPPKLSLSKKPFGVDPAAVALAVVAAAHEQSNARLLTHEVAGQIFSNARRLFTSKKKYPPGRKAHDTARATRFRSVLRATWFSASNSHSTRPTGSGRWRSRISARKMLSG